MVLGLNHFESENTVREFGLQNGVTFPLLLDGSSYSDYNQPGQSPFPLDYLIDRDGNVAYFNTEYDPVTMLALVDSLINPETSVEDEAGDPLPKKFELRGNYPNPFNGATGISFYVPSSGFVKVTVFDLLGRKVAEVFEGEVSAGEKTVTWNPGGTGSDDLNSGIYFYRIKFGERFLNGKMVYLK
jgi:hypothetical protein